MKTKQIKLSLIPISYYIMYRAKSLPVAIALDHSNLKQAILLENAAVLFDQLIYLHAKGFQLLCHNY
ncbi:hypothetical protein T08_564 [Trichinella sp. T8]|nr:hypothetical protein T08_564 [Trichinella sp. T8]